MGRSRRTRSATPAIEVLERETQVVQLRQAKVAWPQIATQVGLSSPSAAQRVYRRAVATRAIARR